MLKEINTRLLEGLECKSLIVEKDFQLETKDSIIESLNSTISNMSVSFQLLSHNYEISQTKEALALNELAYFKKELEDSERKNARLKKGRNTWRVISLIEGSIIAATLYLLNK